ncbi:MAG: sulfite exporter TauE/SafE family protein [Saprospiraceae bacterium]
MLDTLPTLSTTDWIWLMVSGMLIGGAKAGLRGLGMLAIPIMAAIFGGKPSAGLVLPMLIIADTLAVLYYNRDAEWSYIWKLLPAAVIGILTGSVVGLYINDDTFKIFMGSIVIAGLILMVVQERRALPATLTQSYGFGAAFGLLGGFSTMIGNAAGPVMAVYLLAIHLPKNTFIGTGAWFFLLINVIKVPLHVLVWKTIYWESLKISLLTAPAIILGIGIGIAVIKVIPEREFRYFIIIVTFLTALRLFW